MNYHPKLKIAMQEIKEILKKHDIAGAVALHTPGFGEFYLDVEPSYSGAKVTGETVRINIKKENLKTKGADTSNMFHILSDNLMMLAVMTSDVSGIVDKHLESSHFGPGFTSHQEQNN